MSYHSKNPKFNTTILEDQSAGSVDNPASGSHKLVNRSGSIYVRNSSGTEAELALDSNKDYSAKSASYTVTDADNIRTIGMTTGSNTFTFIDSDITAAADTIDETSHGMTNGDPVFLTTTGALPSALSAQKTYYVVGANANDFQLALTVGGSAIDIAADGSGTHTVNHGFLVTLPTASANTSRILTISKVDTGTSRCAVVGESSEFDEYVLLLNDDSITVQSTGSAWEIIGRNITGCKARYYVSSPADSDVDNGSDDIIDFDTQDFDTHSLVTTGTSWNFRAPRTGYYQINAYIRIQAGTNWSEGEYLRLRVNGNGTSSRFINHTSVQEGGASSGYQMSAWGSDIEYMEAGDSLYIAALQNSGSAKGLEDGNVSIVELF